MKSKSKSKKDLGSAKLTLLGRVGLDRRMRGLPTSLMNILAACRPYANFDEFPTTGRMICWPSVDTLAKLLGADRRGTQRAIAVAVQCGYLRRECLGGGAGNASRYEVLWEGKNSGVYTAENSGAGTAEKGGKKCKKQRSIDRPTLLKDSPGALKSPQGERERESEVSLALDSTTPPGAGARSGEGPAPEEDTSSQEDSEQVRKEDAGGADDFAELRALWQRDHLKDDLPEAVAEQRRTYEDALRAGADASEIIEGAKAWVAAADAPRFLDPLVTFLTAKGWTKPPPEKRAQRKSGGKPQRMTPARAMADLVAELRGE